VKILVTGGAGFIASNVVDAYVKAGHSVAVVDDLSRGKREQVNKKARFYKVDIRDRAALEKVFKKEKPQVVNHHAAQIDLRKSVADPAADAAVNVIGSLNLFETALQSGVQKIIFASTGGALYGEQDYFPADENHPIRPLSPYGIAKRSAELYLYYYSEVQGMKYVALRYSNVYGPRQDPHGEAGVVAIFAQKLWGGSVPNINGDGRQTRDYVFVGDVVAANVAALRKGISGPFNIGTGVETDVNEIFEHLNAIIGSKVKAVHVPAKKGEQKRSVLDNLKARKVLGWKPRVKLAEGMNLTAEFFRPKKTALK